MIRKNNCIVNNGDHMSCKEQILKRQKNKEKYGLTPAEIKAIKIPKSKERSYDCMSFDQVLILLIF